MGRRVLPLLLTAAAAAVALVRRARRRQPPTAPRYVEQSAAPALAEPDAADEAAIGRPASDLAAIPDPQVEGEAAPPAGEIAPPALHNAEADDAPSPRAAAVGSPFRSVAWVPLGGEPEADATELRIGFSLIARYESLARIDVRETASQVFVTVLARCEFPTGGWFAYAEAHQATVALRAPLGDRALVHAPAEEPTR